MTLDSAQRIELRFEFIKEAKDTLQQIEEVKNLLEILKTEDSTKWIMKELEIEQAKRDKILAHTKYQAYAWLKEEFKYFKSISVLTQGCIDPLVNKAEEYLCGRIGGLNFTRRQLWEEIWEIYENICCRLVESGNSHLIGSRATTLIREKISWELNTDINTQKNNNKEDHPPYLMCSISKLYCGKVNKPDCIQSLFQLKKTQDNRLHSNHLTELLNTLLFISSLHSFNPLKLDFSKESWAESLGLTSIPSSLHLDNKLMQFSNQLRISHMIENPHSFLKMVIDTVKRFLLVMKDKISHSDSLKGPKLKSYLSHLAHDWYFIQIYQLVVAAIENGLQPPQKEIINLANHLEGLPEHLKGSKTPTLLEGVCKEIAKLTGWSCPGGRHLKNKPHQQSG